MKKIILGLVLLTTALFAELEWAESYDAALKRASKEQKPLMVMLSQEGCPACEFMIDRVFENDDLSDEINMDFITVHIDIRNDTIPKGLGYIGTPTFHFLDADGKKVERLDGGANVKDFTRFIRDVKAVLKKRK